MDPSQSDYCDPAIEGDDEGHSSSETDEDQQQRFGRGKSVGARTNQQIVVKKQASTHYGQRFLDMQENQIVKPYYQQQSAYGVGYGTEAIKAGTSYNNFGGQYQKAPNFNKKNSFGFKQGQEVHNEYRNRGVLSPRTQNKNKIQTQGWKNFAVTQDGFYKKQQQESSQQRRQVDVDAFGKKTFYAGEKQGRKYFSKAGPDENKIADFHKPRAMSRQAESKIRIEVHKDKQILNHLQREHQTGMNLVFYDFNGSSASQTQQNFFPGGRVQAVENGQRAQTRGGDRMPTRERCQRSANQQMRPRIGGLDDQPASNYPYEQF